MYQISIHIDPALRAAHGPEVAYAWRTLLAGVGYAWRECDVDASAEIVYSPRPPTSPAKLWVRADPERWAAPTARRLAGVAGQDGWIWPLYKADTGGALAADECGLRLDRDIAFDLFWLLAGVEEQFLPTNRHGHFNLAGGPWPSAQRAAPASALGAALGRLLVELGLPPGLPRWPYGKTAAAAVSHDVDYPEAVRWIEPLRVLRRQGLAGLPAAAAVASGRRTHWHFASWLELDRCLAAPGAFYFVPRRGSLIEYTLGTPDPFYDVTTPRFRRLIRALDKAGGEIGLQASYRACEQPDGVARERAALEAATGVAVAGGRHHYWRLLPRWIDETLLAHERAGLLYDSSLGHDRYLGWRRGSSWPYYPFIRGERRALRTLQLPLAWMDAQLFFYRAENPGDPDTLLCELAATARAQGGLLLVDLHEYVYDEVLFPGWRRAYVELFEHVRASGAFWMARPRDIAAHWAARQATIERASCGL